MAICDVKHCGKQFGVAGQRQHPQLVAEVQAEAQDRTAPFDGVRRQDEVRAAAAGRTINGQPVDLDALLEDVDLTKFLTESGDVDTAKVAARLEEGAA